jgi:hypothetical protein
MRTKEDKPIKRLERYSAHNISTVNVAGLTRNEIFFSQEAIMTIERALICAICNCKPNKRLFYRFTADCGIK